VKVIFGDAGAVLPSLEADSVDSVVTSPPYWRLRDYGVPGQVGQEETLDQYLGTLRALFGEVRRVLKPTGTCWVNIGDCYACASKPAVDPYRCTTSGKLMPPQGRAPVPDGLQAKSLIGLPWRVAMALQQDGWVLRNAVVWHKPNGMPESVRDRFAGKYEYVFLLAKSPRYYFNLDAVRTDRGANPGDVWSIPTRPSGVGHFAVMPTELVRRCLQAGCPRWVCANCGLPAEGDWCRCGEGAGRRPAVVLDPFVGSGTTLLVARELGLEGVGIELNPEYESVMRKRLGAGNVLLPDVSFHCFREGE